MGLLDYMVSILLPEGITATDDEVIQEIETEKQIRPGDVIFVERMGDLYRHYGIYVGKGEVIHYSAKDGDFGNDISIHKTSMEHFLEASSQYYICKFPKRADIENYHLFTKKEAVQRAYKRLGERQYSLLENNCEHFAIWCRTNISVSKQAEKAANIFLKLTDVVTKIID